MTDKSLYDRRYWEGGLPDGSGYHAEGYRDFPVNAVTFDKLWTEKPESFIEIGCAKGYIVRRMQIAGIKAAGVDVSEYCFATRVASTVEQCDITKDNLPFHNNDFDLSFSKAVLEHIEEEHLERVIKEIARVSKRGVHCPSFNNIEGDTDKTHRTLKDKAWWEATFAKYAPDWPVKIIDKEEIEDAKEIKFQQPVVMPHAVFAGRYVNEDVETMNQEKPTRKRALNVGSWTVMYASTPDICILNMDIGDLRAFSAQNGYNFSFYKAPDKMPFKDATMDGIYCSHMLEHLDRKEGEAFLKECFRVLKPGAYIRLLVPNTTLLSKQLLSEELDMHKVYNVAAEQSEDNAEIFYHLLLDGHKTIYDGDALGVKLIKAGFVIPMFKKQNDTSWPVFDKFIMDMYPEISLIVEAKKPESVLSITEKLIDVAEQLIPHASPVEKVETTQFTDKLANTGVLVEVGGSPGVPESQNPRITEKREINKICLISTPMLQVPPKAYGGLERVVYDLAFILAKMGKDVTVVAPDGSNVPGCKMFHIGKEAGTVDVDWRIAEKHGCDKYRDLVVNGKFDVIHEHSWLGYAYRLKQDFPNLPICHTHHGGLHPDWLRPLPPAIKDLNMFAISRWMQSLYTSQGLKNVKQCYNGIDLSEYKIQHEKGDRLLFVGRLDSFKQPDVAIEVARKAGFGIDVVGGTFVQDKNYCQKVLAMCKDKAKAYPDASQQKKIELMQNAKALLIPSNMGEPFGLIAVEAMACGTSVIAFDDGALKEIVGDGGFVVPKSVDDMVAAVKALDKVCPPPQTCRAQAEKFSQEAMAQRYLQLYSELII